MQDYGKYASKMRAAIYSALPLSLLCENVINEL